MCKLGRVVTELSRCPPSSLVCHELRFSSVAQNLMLFPIAVHREYEDQATVTILTHLGLMDRKWPVQ